jgi:hypothetical protein
MIRKTPTCALVVAATLSLGYAHTARAITIGFSPSDSTFEVGDVFDVDVFVSGLPPEQVVSGYDLGIGFDDEVIALTSVTFGEQLGSPTAPVLPGSIGGSFVLPGGTLNVFQTSLLFDFELLGLQTESVNLFTIQFEALTPGTSSLSFLRGTDDIKGVESDEPFVPSILAVDEVSSGNVNVVPEPSTLSLLVLGILGWCVRRRWGDPR